MPLLTLLTLLTYLVNQDYAISHLHPPTVHTIVTYTNVKTCSDVGGLKRFFCLLVREKPLSHSIEIKQTDPSPPSSLNILKIIIIAVGVIS